MPHTPKHAYPDPHRDTYTPKGTHTPHTDTPPHINIHTHILLHTHPVSQRIYSSHTPIHPAQTHSQIFTLSHTLIHGFLDTHRYLRPCTLMHTYTRADSSLVRYNLRTNTTHLDTHADLHTHSEMYPCGCTLIHTPPPHTIHTHSYTHMIHADIPRPIYTSGTEMGGHRNTQKTGPGTKSQ